MFGFPSKSTHLQVTQEELADSRRKLGVLEDRIHDLEKTVGDLRVNLAELDPGALENLRRSVLNALRSLRRVQAAQESREGEIEAPEGSQAAVDDISRQALERRKRVLPRA